MYDVGQVVIERRSDAGRGWIDERTVVVEADATGFTTSSGRRYGPHGTRRDPWGSIRATRYATVMKGGLDGVSDERAGLA